jgi:hypothetical protein
MPQTFIVTFTYPDSGHHEFEREFATLEEARRFVDWLADRVETVQITNCDGESVT